MTADYKLLTREQFNTLHQRVNRPGEENSMSDLMRAVERAPISNSHASTPLAPPDVAPVGEAGTMPGTSGFTMACFKAEDVPVGTKLYMVPASQDAQDAKRWRWLRDRLRMFQYEDASRLSGRIQQTIDDGLPFGTEGSFWDGRIDAAIAAAKGKEC